MDGSFLTILNWLHVSLAPQATLTELKANPNLCLFVVKKLFTSPFESVKEMCTALNQELTSTELQEFLKEGSDPSRSGARSPRKSRSPRANNSTDSTGGATIGGADHEEHLRDSEMLNLWSAVIAYIVTEAAENNHYIEEIQSLCDGDQEEMMRLIDPYVNGGGDSPEGSPEIAPADDPIVDRRRSEPRFSDRNSGKKPSPGFELDSINVSAIENAEELDASFLSFVKNGDSVLHDAANPGMNPETKPGLASTNTPSKKRRSFTGDLFRNVAANSGGGFGTSSLSGGKLGGGSPPKRRNSVTTREDTLLTHESGISISDGRPVNADDIMDVRRVGGGSSTIVRTIVQNPTTLIANDPTQHNEQIGGSSCSSASKAHRENSSASKDHGYSSPNSGTKQQHSGSKLQNSGLKQPSSMKRQLLISEISPMKKDREILELREQIRDLQLQISKSTNASASQREMQIDKEFEICHQNHLLEEELEKQREKAKRQDNKLKDLESTNLKLTERLSELEEYRSMGQLNGNLREKISKLESKLVDHNKVSKEIIEVKKHNERLENELKILEKDYHKIAEREKSHLRQKEKAGEETVSSLQKELEHWKSMADEVSQSLEEMKTHYEESRKDLETAREAADQEFAQLHAKFHDEKEGWEKERSEQEAIWKSERGSEIQKVLLELKKVKEESVMKDSQYVRDIDELKSKFTEEKMLLRKKEAEQRLALEEEYRFKFEIREKELLSDKEDLEMKLKLLEEENFSEYDKILEKERACDDRVAEIEGHCKELEASWQGKVEYLTREHERNLKDQKDLLEKDHKKDIQNLESLLTKTQCDKATTLQEERKKWSEERDREMTDLRAQLAEKYDEECKHLRQEAEGYLADTLKREMGKLEEIWVGKENQWRREADALLLQAKTEFDGVCLERDKKIEEYRLLEKKAADDLIVAKEEVSQLLEQKEKEHKQKEDKQSNEMNARRAKTQETIEQLKKRHTAELDSQKAQFDEQRKKIETKFDADKAHYLSKQNGEKQEILQKHKNEVQELISQYEGEKRQLKDKHYQEKEEIENEHKQQIREVEEKLRNQMNSEEKGYESKIEELDALRKSDLTRLQAELDAEKEKLQGELDSERAKMNEELEEIQQQSEQEREEMSKLLESERKQHEQETAALNDKLAKLNDKLQSEISELSRLNESNHNEIYAELKSKLQELQEDKIKDTSERQENEMEISDLKRKLAHLQSESTNTIHRLKQESADLRKRTEIAEKKMLETDAKWKMTKEAAGHYRSKMGNLAAYEAFRGKQQSELMNDLVEWQEKFECLVREYRELQMLYESETSLERNYIEILNSCIAAENAVANRSLNGGEKTGGENTGMLVDQYGNEFTSTFAEEMTSSIQTMGANRISQQTQILIEENQKLRKEKREMQLRHAASLRQLAGLDNLMIELQREDNESMHNSSIMSHGSDKIRQSIVGGSVLNSSSDRIRQSMIPPVGAGLSRQKVCAGKKYANIEKNLVSKKEETNNSRTFGPNTGALGGPASANSSLGGPAARSASSSAAISSVVHNDSYPSVRDSVRETPQRKAATQDRHDQGVVAPSGQKADRERERERHDPKADRERDRERSRESSRNEDRKPPYQLGNSKFDPTSPQVTTGNREFYMQNFKNSAHPHHSLGTPPCHPRGVMSGGGMSGGVPMSAGKMSNIGPPSGMKPMSSGRTPREDLQGATQRHLTGIEEADENDSSLVNSGSVKRNSSPINRMGNSAQKMGNTAIKGDNHTSKLGDSAVKPGNSPSKLGNSSAIKLGGNSAMKMGGSALEMQNSAFKMPNSALKVQTSASRVGGNSANSSRRNSPNKLSTRGSPHFGTRSSPHFGSNNNSPMEKNSPQKSRSPDPSPRSSARPTSSVSGHRSVGFVSGQKSDVVFGSTLACSSAGGEATALATPACSSASAGHGHAGLTPKPSCEMEDPSLELPYSQEYNSNPSSAGRPSAGPSHCSDNQNSAGPSRGVIRSSSAGPNTTAVHIKNNVDSADAMGAGGDAGAAKSILKSSRTTASGLAIGKRNPAMLREASAEKRLKVVNTIQNTSAVRGNSAGSAGISGSSGISGSARASGGATYMARPSPNPNAMKNSRAAVPGNQVGASKKRESDEKDRCSQQ